MSPVFVLHSAVPGQPPYPVTGSGLCLGRAPTNHIVLADDLVSWQHARLQAVNDGVIVVDENSTNGVYINERKIPRGEPFPLRPGQTLRVGNSRFVLAAAAVSSQVDSRPGRSIPQALPASQNTFVKIIGGFMVGVVGLTLIAALASTSSAQPYRRPSLAPTSTATPPPPTPTLPLVLMSSTAVPTAVAPLPVAPMPTANVTQVIYAEMEAARSALKHYAGQIDLALNLANPGANLNCAAIVANYNLTQAAHERVITPPPELQELVDQYHAALLAALDGTSVLTQGCRRVVSGLDTGDNLTPQLKSARHSAALAVEALDKIISQITP